MQHIFSPVMTAQLVFLYNTAGTLP